MSPVMPADVPPPPPSSVNLLVVERRRRTRLWIGGAVLVATLTGAAVLGARSLAKSGEAAALKPWAQLQGCMLGEPLAAGERPSARVRARQLTAMGVAVEKRAAPNEAPWPARCATHAHALAEARKNAGETAGVAAAAERLARALKDKNAIFAPMGKEIEDLWTETEKARIPGGAVEPPAAPGPKAAAPMTLDRLPNEARLSPKAVTLDMVHTEPNADTTLRFVVDDAAVDAPLLCTLGAEDARLRCAAIGGAAATLRPGLRLFGTTEAPASPHLFVGDRGKAGVFRSTDGERVMDGLAYGAYGAHVRADGTTLVALWKDAKPEVRLQIFPPQGKAEEHPLLSHEQAGNPYYNLGIFWDWVAYKVFTKEAPGLRLIVRKVPKGSAPPEAPIDVGELLERSQVEGGDESPHLTACRAAADGALVIRAKGWSSEYLSFFAGGKFTPPVEVIGQGGDLSCRPGEAVITGAFGLGGVVQKRCTASGCKAAEAASREVFAGQDETRPKSERQVAAFEQDGAPMLLYLAGDNGGLRSRRAAVPELAAAADVVHFDDHVHDGVYKSESTVLGMRVLTANRVVLLLLNTVAGTYALRVDAQGNLAPLPIERR